MDSLLVIAEMYAMLQLRSLQGAFDDSALRTLLQARHGRESGDAVFRWLRPRGGEWDAALDGSCIAPITAPEPASIDTRRVRAAALAAPAFDETHLPGSNNWAVAGGLSTHGAALLANDMHLNHSVPNLWFRAEIHLSGAPVRRIAGVTLPGVPAVIAGSNGDIAWGFTNAYGRWFDWVPLEASEQLETIEEIIEVKGAEAVRLAVPMSRWGPVAREWRGRKYALWWIAHQPEAIDARFTAIMDATTLADALNIAQSSGIPHQNIVLADRTGGIAWTIAGRMFARPPAAAVAAAATGATRAGFATPDSPTPLWLAPDAYPVIRNPAGQRLWTANNRVLGGEGGAAIGDGGVDLGARAGQIRDRLKEKNRFTEKDLYAIQLDDEARFMKRWADLLSASPATEITTLMRHWNGRADTDQAGYRLVRAFRQNVLAELWKAWIAAALPDDGASGLKLGPDGRFEYAAWQALSSKAPHLLPSGFASWDDFLAAQASASARELKAAAGSLAAATWGRRNEARIHHPFSRVIPMAGWFLNMPPAPLAGDAHMPRVAAPAFGASERLVVAPGHEDLAILTMPGGQSGHPLSPFYGAGHGAWLAGETTPLLAGPARHRLTLHP